MQKTVLRQYFKCMAGSSVLTKFIIGKFIYHLPFYHLIQQYREFAITISNFTMAEWYGAAMKKLKLFYNLLKKQILSSENILIGESGIPIINNEKHNTRKDYEWCLHDDIIGDTVFHYNRENHSEKVARELLSNYIGLAQCNGYDAYEQNRTIGLLKPCKEEVYKSIGREQGTSYTNIMPYGQIVQN